MRQHSAQTSNMDNDTRLRNVGDSQSSGYDTSSRHTLQSQENLERNKKMSCTSKIIAAFLVIVIITLTIIFTVEKCKSSRDPKSCSDGWIGYLGKCFYFAENTTTWAASQNFCVSHAATLVVFNTTQELDFLKRYSDHSQYWIGLSRKPGQAWEWIDGTVYNGWFKVMGFGEGAYLHKSGVSSSSTHLVRKWICSKPDTCIPGS